MPNLKKYSYYKVENPKNITERAIAFNELDFHQQNGFILTLEELENQT